MNASLSQRILAARMVMPAGQRETEDSLRLQAISTFVSVYQSLKGFGTHNMRVKTALEMVSHELNNTLTINNLEAFIDAQIAIETHNSDMTESAIQQLSTSPAFAQFEKEIANVIEVIDQGYVKVHQLHQQIERLEDEIGNLEDEIGNLEQKRSDLEAVRDSARDERQRENQEQLSALKRVQGQIIATMNRVQTARSIIDKNDSDNFSES